MNTKSAWLSETKVPHASTAILVGNIEPTVIEKCINEYQSGIFLISVEKNEHEFASKFFHLNPNLNKQHIISSLSEFFLLDSINPPEIKVSASIQKGDTEIYENFVHLALNEIDTLLRARKTRKETGFIRQLQIFSNLDGYLLNRIPEEWKSLGQNNLVVVVGAGPSLDNSLPLIKSGLPSPLVIAADSSLRALAKENISPDFVVSIDPEKSFEACSEPNFTPGTVILSSQSHISWSENWENKCYISGRVISEDWLAEKGIGKSSLLGVNNAGLTALSLADFVSPGAILLVGMDLAGGGDGRIRYAKNTGRSNIEIDANIFHEIPGNYSETVTTPFFSDWQETSDASATYSKKRSIINLNDRGALLEGTTLIHPKDFMEVKQLLSENLVPFEKRNEQILQKRRSIGGLGLIQILTLMTSICDQIWEKIDTESNESHFANLLKELFASKDHASLLGDFAFSVMPSLATNCNTESFEMEKDQLKVLLWKLEDGILRCNPPEDFILRFLTEKFS